VTRLLLAAALVGVASLSGPAAATASPLLPFTDAEVRAIVRHGPWPTPPGRDPSNRVSANPAAIALGQRLFFDARLSVNGAVACATCHVPERRWTDGRPRAAGLDLVDRNTPGLANVRLQRWFGWDGAHDSLWAQSIRPLLDRREMGASARDVAALVRADADLACRYARAFGAPPSADDEAVLVDVGKALAAFQETLASGRTPFDDFRDALARGDREAAARYPLDAQRGAQIFVGKGACAVCHLGPNFTNGEFHDIGIPFFAAPGRVDSGRFEGIRRLRASAYNLLGPHSDDPARTTATGTRHVALGQRNWGEFRVPSLRDVALTAPYMHNGSLPTLRDVVRHYSELDEDRIHADGERLLKPLRLSPPEIDDLLAFLRTLADPAGASARRPPPATPPCR
jgi:cytochrome c peroxidase